MLTSTDPSGARLSFTPVCIHIYRCLQRDFVSSSVYSCFRDKRDHIKSTNNAREIPDPHGCVYGDEHRSLPTFQMPAASIVRVRMMKKAVSTCPV